MSEIFNIYCDESCHLENDGQKSMVLGAITCPKDKAREIAVRLREIKEEWEISRHMEVKWTGVSPAKVGFYRHWLDYFFDDDDLTFRALVIPRKSDLDHGRYAQSHDDWYWKMYFDMLKAILSEERRYRIFLDIKDTLGGKRVANLHKVLSNNLYDFDREIVNSVQLVHSHEIEQMQLTDLLIGALSYKARGFDTSPAKLELVKRFKERSKLSLERSTLLSAKKVNLLFWKPNFPKD
jgi:hypothetical protein